MSNPEPTRNYDAASFCGPFPSFVAVRYFKVRPTGAHLISREGKRQSAERSAPRKVEPQIFTALWTTVYFASRQPHPTQPKANSVKDQRRKKLLTVGPGVMFTYTTDIRLSQEQKGEPLNYFVYPCAEWPAGKGFDDAFCISRFVAARLQKLRKLNGPRAAGRRSN